MRGLAIVVALVTLALDRSTAGASTGDIIAPQHPPLYTANDGWQAGTCKIDIPTCSVDTPPQFFETAAAHPPVGFTQFIVKHTPEEGPLRKTGRRTERRPRRPAGRPQRQPGGNAALRSRRLRSAAALDCAAAGAKVGTSFVTAADPLLGIRRAAAHRRRLQHQTAARANRLCSGSNCSATKSSSKPTSNGAATSTRGSRSPSRKRSSCRASKASSSKTGWSSTAPPATAPSSPPRAPASARRVRDQASRAASTRPGCSPPPTPKRPAPATSSRPAPHRPSSRRSRPAPRRKVRHDPLRAGHRGRPRHAADRLAGRRHGRRHGPPYTWGGQPGQLGDPSRRRRPARSAWASTPPPPTASRPATTPSSRTKGKAPIGCPPQSKIGTVEIQSPPLPEGNLNGDVYVGKQLSRDPESGERVPDLHRRQVGPLRGRGAAARPRQSEPDRPAS